MVTMKKIIASAGTVLILSTPFAFANGMAEVSPSEKVVMGENSVGQIQIGNADLKEIGSGEVQPNVIPVAVVTFAMIWGTWVAFKAIELGAKKVIDESGKYVVQKLLDKYSDYKISKEINKILYKQTVLRSASFQRTIAVFGETLTVGATVDGDGVIKLQSID